MKKSNRSLLSLLLLFNASATFALDALPPVGVESQPQGCSATASCNVSPQSVKTTPKVALPDWCQNAATPVEKMICTSPKLAQLDNQLNQAIVSGDPMAKSEVGRSRRSERDVCTTGVCIEQWYQKTLAQLVMGGQPQNYPAPIQRQPAPPMVTQYTVPAPPAPVMMQQPGATSVFTYWQSSELTAEEQRLQQMQSQLAILDNQLNERWKSRSRSRKETTEQKAWLQQRDAAIRSGASADQIAQMYRSRIAQL